MTVLLVSVGVVTDAVVVVGVTMVELVSVGETSVVPDAAIGAVSDVPLSVAVVSFADGAVPYADVSVPPVSVFSAASRLQPTQRATQSTTRINLRMEQLSFAERVRQNMGRAADPVALLLIAIAALRVIATLTIFSATTDEPLHVTCGLQLVQEGRYDFQLENPPLPRVVFAWPLHLAGGRFDAGPEALEQMRAVFYSTGNYEQALFVARIGNILFFVIAALATWRLARRELGPGGGALATLLFTTQPVILGMSGIANLDMAAVAGLALALLAFSRWIEVPAPTRALVAGLAYGVSIGLKFSNLLFTAAACLALFLVHSRDWRRAARALPLAILGALAGIAATYGFGYVPLSHFWTGITRILDLDRSGIHMSYAFGLKTFDGWWWYFPAVLAFKTTLATLLLVFAGALFRRDRVWLGGVAATVAILLPAMPAKLDLGIRYVLPLYVPLTIAAAAAAMTMLSAGKRARIAATLLLVWQCAASLATHPDSFPYFNELAGREPGRLFVDSNLDWGQDMLRLRAVLREVNAPHLARSMTGLHDFDRLGFPPSREIDPWVPATGWTAVSEHMFRLLEEQGGYWWLRELPYRRVGRSIRLYYYSP